MNPRTIRQFLLLILLLNTVSISADEKLRRFITFDSSYGLADNSAQTIKCTKTGRMVISTIGHVNFYDGNSFTHIDPTVDNIHPLPAYNGHYHLYFDLFHHLWLKDKKVITCVDLMTERFVGSVDAVYKQLGMTGPVDDFFADSDCHVWYLSGRQLRSAEYGVDLPVRKDVELQDMDVCDSSQVFLFYADGLLSVYDLKSRHHLYDTKPEVKEEEEGGYSRSSVVRFHQGKFYQIRNGNKTAVLLSFDIHTREWRVLLQLPYHLNNIEPHDGCIYIPSSYGYWVYSLVGGTWEHVEYLTMVGGRKLLTDINTMTFDRQGGMWMGTERRGLLYAKPYPEPFVAYSWEQPEAISYSQMMDRQEKSDEPLPRRVNCVYYDSRGWRWSGTYTGLQLQKGKGTAVRTFTRKDGLNNEMIHTIIEDDNHDIWIGTSFGITRLWIAGDSVHLIRSYDHYDNVPSESFINGRVMKTDDGTIVMQALDHVIAFNPKDFHHEQMDKVRLYPKLSKWLVNGREVLPGMQYDGHIMIDRTITRARELSVNYNQTSMLLIFTGLNYWRPIQTNYRLRIKGVYDQWQVFNHANAENMVDDHGMLRLPLNGLSPGTYKIELQASMSPDKWNVEPFVWTLHVNQPWWRSTGIYVLLFVVLLLMLVVSMLLFNRNTRLRMILNNEEADMQKSIRGYVQRCNALSSEILTPYTQQVDNITAERERDNREFVDVMAQVVKYVNTHEEGSYSLKDLAECAGVDLQHMYVLLSENLYKSPRQLALRLRLQQAAELLRTTDFLEEEIADRCGFVSPNYFIASFYHQYRQTPIKYRESVRQ